MRRKGNHASDTSAEGTASTAGVPGAQGAIGASDTRDTSRAPLKSDASHVLNLSRGRIVLRWTLALLMAAAIFFMSARTASDLGGGVLAQLKLLVNGWFAAVFGVEYDISSTLAHFGEYTLLGFLLANALRSHIPLARAVVLAIVCASIYGITDEVHQIFVDERYCDVADWATDTLGAALGALLFRIAAERSKANEPLA